MSIVVTINGKLWPLEEPVADEIERLRDQLVKRTEALAAIEKVCADLERIMCLPDVKQLKHIWYTARDALIDDQRK